MPPALRSAVIAALQLGLGAFHLRFCIAEHGGLVGVKLHDARVRLLADEQEHVDQRHLVRADIAHELSVVALLRGVGGIDHLGHLIVQPGQFGKLPGRQLCLCVIKKQ